MNLINNTYLLGSTPSVLARNLARLHAPGPGGRFGTFVFPGAASPAAAPDADAEVDISGSGGATERDANGLKRMSAAASGRRPPAKKAKVTTEEVDKFKGLYLAEKDGAPKFSRREIMMKMQAS